MSKNDSEALELEGIVDKLAKLKDAVLQNKPARFSLASLFFIFAILLFIPILVNTEALKGSSAKKLTEVLGHDVIIKGDVSIEILPVPKIIAHDVLILNYKPKDSKYNYNAFVKRAEVRLKIFYSSNSSIIKEISFLEMVAEKRYVTSNTQEQEGSDIRDIKLKLKNKYVSNSKVDKSSSGIDLDSLSLMKVTKSDFSLKKFPTINIENAKIISYDIYDNKREYKSLHCDIGVSNNKISAEGYFAVEDILTSFESKLVFDGKLKEKPNSYLQIKSPSLNFRFDGNLSTAKGLGEDFAIKGSILSEIKDLRDFYLSYVGAKSDFSSKLKNNTPTIKISAKVSSDKDGSFLEKLKIKSPIINGTGEVSIYKSSKIPIIDVLLDIKDVDIDSIWSTAAVKSSGKTGEEQDSSIFGIDKVETFLSGAKPVIAKKDFDLTLEIKTRLAVYKNTTLSDLNIYLSSHSQGQLIFNPISFRFPGNGKFHANGELNSSSGVPKFAGKINISGNNPKSVLGQGYSRSKGLKLDFITNFNLYSDLVLLPSRMDLSNLFITLNDKETEISGDLDYSIVDKKPFFKGSLRINNFDIKSQIKNFNITKYTNRGSLIEKVFWLNDLSYETSLRIQLDKINYEKEEFLNNSLDLKVQRGSIRLSDVIIDPKNRNSRASFFIDISQATPKLVMNLSAKSLAILSDANEEAKPKYISQIQGLTNHEEDEIDQHLLYSTNSFDQFFDLVSLNGFSGEFKFVVQNLLLKNKPLEKFIFHSKLNNGILDNVLVQANTGDANFKYQGSIGLKKIKTLSGTAMLNNFNIQPIATDLFNITNLNTTLNASMAISSFGGDSNSFAENIDGILKFNAIAPLVKGYGLRNLIRKMFYPKKNFEELKEPANIVGDDKSQTRFKKATGSMILKKGSAKIHAKVQGILSNSVLSGNIGLVDKDVSLAFNTIFLTGSKKKLTPIAIATNISGSVGNLAYASNYDQIMQYIGIKEVEKVSKEKSKEEKDGDKKGKKDSYSKKDLEKIEKERSNKARSVLRKQGIYLPKDNPPPADYIKNIQPIN